MNSVPRNGTDASDTASSASAPPTTARGARAPSSSAPRVPRAQRNEPTRVLVGASRRSRADLACEEVRRRGGDVGEREDQRAEHGRADGERHRPEHAALEPLERENRHVHGDDDRDAEHDGPADLERRSRISVAPCVGATRVLRRRSRRTKFSTITTDASTMSPKSSAPRLIRFAETPELAHREERDEQRERDDRRRDAATRGRCGGTGTGSR